MAADAAKSRLVSLDVFRGITIAGMVLVNNPGTWSAIYSPLEHAEWNGWTPTDLVFPFFLFIVGVAITLALGKRVEQNGVNSDVYIKIFRRSALIFLLGLFLATFPFYNFSKGEWLDLSTVRIMGVLQRIAVCYLIAALIFVKTTWKITMADGVVSEIERQRLNEIVRVLGLDVDTLPAEWIATLRGSLLPPR